MSVRERGNTALQHLATPVRRSATVTVTTQSVLMESDIAKGQAERKRKGTEKDDTERKKRDVTSPPAVAVAGGGMTVRRAMATEGTNTRRARGAKRARKPARRLMQTKRTRRLWSNHLGFLFYFLSFYIPDKNEQKAGM